MRARHTNAWPARRDVPAVTDHPVRQALERPKMRNAPQTIGITGAGGESARRVTARSDRIAHSLALDPIGTFPGWIAK
jgi:hypothetical protein